MTNMNQCYKCKELKDSIEFFKNKRKSNGLHSYCKACNKEATKIASKKYRQDPAKEKNSKLKNRYGITLLGRDQMIADQSGCCAICNIELSTAKVVHLDHCHTSGDVRGVLCQPCNIGLGGFKDSIETLENAIEYLKRHKVEVMGNHHMLYQLSVNY
jgi:hypothetical protein